MIGGDKVCFLLVRSPPPFPHFFHLWTQTRTLILVYESRGVFRPSHFPSMCFMLASQKIKWTRMSEWAVHEAWHIALIHTVMWVHKEQKHTRGTARHGARFSSEELFAVLLFSFCSFSCPVLSFHFVCARRYERIRALLYIRVYRTDYSAAAASNRPTNHYMLIRTHTNDEEMCEEQLGE